MWFDINPARQLIPVLVEGEWPRIVPFFLRSRLQNLVYIDLRGLEGARDELSPTGRFSPELRRLHSWLEPMDEVALFRGGRFPSSPPPSQNESISLPTMTAGRDIVLPRTSGIFSRLARLFHRPRNHSLVRVYYATDRKPTRDTEQRVHYGPERSDDGYLQYGWCTISIPKVHTVGKLESPSLLKLEFRPNPDRHILLRKVKSLPEAAFFERIAAAVAKSPTRDAFIFIHGYNVTFADAARRTGQIAFDLDFVGAPILYSWPSNGHVADYLKDETNIAWTAPHFEHFLDLVAAYSGAKRVHVIAHSMGNRAVCDALKHLSATPDASLKVNHLVLAAPDIDAATFRELADTLQQLSGRITLYASSNDKALLASKKIHGYSRAGEPLVIINGLDTIDASSISTDFLSHSYFSDNWPLLSDIHAILKFDHSPSQRFGLYQRQHKDGTYYAFRRS